MESTLIEYGLEKVGSWIQSSHGSVHHLRAKCPFGIQFEIPRELLGKPNIVYAFVFDSVVRYVGETTAGMRSRFEGYRYGNPLESDTDNRIKLAITHSISVGESVEIWAGNPVSQLKLDSGSLIELPASKPVEERLIAHFQPDLNVRNIG